MIRLSGTIVLLILLQCSNAFNADSISKGAVSFLTDLFKSENSNVNRISRREITPPPETISELEQRIQEDYEKFNYLWTGNIDRSAFDTDCVFSDPTISFQGLETFEKNTENLIKIVEKLVDKPESLLLSIETNEEEGYIQSRWNMKGDLKLPWNPAINVIGNTKFFYNEKRLVYLYDETWELPAWKALLQIITPADTFPNSMRETKSNESSL